MFPAGRIAPVIAEGISRRSRAETGIASRACPLRNGQPWPPLLAHLPPMTINVRRNWGAYVPTLAGR